MEISDFFSFFVPGYEYSPMFKKGRWDGKIRMYDRRSHVLYRGLLSHLYKFAADRQYTIDKTFKLRRGTPDIDALLERINLPEKYAPRPYQIDGYEKCVQERRAVVLSPTSSGKSLLIYMLLRHYDKPTLIIVPTINLTRQMAGDFRDYGYKDSIQIIDGKADKSWKGEVDSNVVLSTWQSIYKQPKEWFDQFEVVMGDEAHLFSANSLQTAMKKMHNVKYRFAFTGTLQETETHQLMIQALFGEVFSLITTKEMIDSGYASPIDINIILFKHKNHRFFSKKYMDEKDYIVSHVKRNSYIRNLAKNIDGNTLILFEWVDKHGRVLYDTIKSKLQGTDRKVFFIYGGTDGEQREEIRKILSNQTDAILVASYGTLSTGANIPSLHNVIFASPSKGKIRVLQSIGRGLRLHASKYKMRLFDLADDLRQSSNADMNNTLKHLYNRVKIYGEQKFDYKIIKVDL